MILTYNVHELIPTYFLVNKWIKANKLTLNTMKTELMLIASKRKFNQFPANLQILINGSLKQKKVLGVITDDKLK